MLVAALRPLPPLARAQALAVVAFATVGEVTGSLVWGVYTVPAAQPAAVHPAGARPRLSERPRARGLVRERLVVGAAAVGAIVLGRRRADRAAAARRRRRDRRAAPLRLPLALALRAPTYAGVFLVVGALELYGTSIGTWRWAVELPGLGIPDGNPPSGVASGYVWFDVMALLVAPWLVAGARMISRRTAMGPAFNRRDRLMAPTTRRSHACPSSSASPSAAHSELRRGTASTV